MVQAKDKLVVMATKIKANKINQMTHKGQTLMDKDSLEARGEVAKIFKEIMEKMTTDNVGFVEEQIILNVILHQGIRVTKDNKTIMHLPTGIQMIQRDCL